MSVRRRPLREVLPDALHEPARAALSAAAVAAATPWYVRSLVGCGAWIAASLMLSFLALGVVAAEEIGAIVLGLALAGVGVVLHRRGGDNVFVAQLALSLGLAGQALAIGGIGGIGESVEIAAAATVVIQAVVLLLDRDATQRFLATFFGAAALLLLLRLAAPAAAVDAGVVAVALGAHLLLLRQARFRGVWSGLPVPAAYGLATALFAALLVRTWFWDALAGLSPENLRLTLPRGAVTAGLAAVALLTLLDALRETGAGLRGRTATTAVAALGLVAALTLHTPGVIAALGVLLLAFHRRAAPLLGIAIAFALAFGVQHYYDLEATVLAKSVALLGSGAVLLAAREVLRRRLPAPSATAAGEEAA